MSADQPDEIHIPTVFLFHLEGQKLLNLMAKYPTLVVRLGANSINEGFLSTWYISNVQSCKSNDVPKFVDLVFLQKSITLLLHL